MKIDRLNIGNIPSIICGERNSKVFIAVHGNMSSKEDEVIKILAENATSKGYQVLSFDLPEHGERKDDTNYLCKVQNCVKDLKEKQEIKTDFGQTLYWDYYKEEQLNYYKKWLGNVMY